MTVERIISGGQTGADRGGLDAAIALDIPHGGWCPKGRRAEDGRIPVRYDLIETESASYVDRTSMNIVHSDATLIFVHDLAGLEPGSRLTRDLAARGHKPCLVLNAFVADPSGKSIKKWLARIKPRVLNVAGNRESVAPGIQAATRDQLCAALGSKRTVTTVINRRGNRTDFDVYVGRPSIWGNPYSTKSESLGKFIVETLDEALSGYARHLDETPHLVSRARRELRGRRLACWCVDDLKRRAPIVCHAQILARVADGVAPLEVLPAREKGLGRLAEELKKMGAGT